MLTALFARPEMVPHLHPSMKQHIVAEIVHA